MAFLFKDLTTKFYLTIKVTNLNNCFNIPPKKKKNKILKLIYIYTDGYSFYLFSC